MFVSVVFLFMVPNPTGKKQLNNANVQFWVYQVKQMNVKGTLIEFIDIVWVGMLLNADATSIKW